MLALLGGLGLLLAVVGIQAVVAYSVAQRTREIGIRMAVGAMHGNILRMVLAEVGRLMVIGSAVGLFAAFLITQPLAMFLVPGLRPTDPYAYAAVMTIMAAAGFVAAFVPTRRVKGIDPSAALRCE